MHNSFLNFFLASYSNSTMEIKRKSKGLLFGSIIVIFLILTSIPPLFIGKFGIGALITLIVMILNILIIAAALYLLKINMFDWAISLITIISPLAIFFIYYGSTPDFLELGRLTVAFCVIMGFISLISLKKISLYIYLVLSLLSIIIFTIVKIILKEWIFSPLLIREIFYDLLLFSVGAGFIIVAFNIIEERMRISLKESEADKERILRFGSLLTSSKDSINIGGQLLSVTDQAKLRVDRIYQELLVMKNEIGLIQTEIRNFSDSNSRISDSIGIVRKSIHDYHEAVMTTSSAIQEMTSSINNVSQITQNRKESILSLIHSFQTAEEEMKKSLDAILSISNQSEKLFEVVGVITNIASQTNLLAMNAAIEAAHAGDYGKGFAVVSDEIRSLSLQTGSNISIITTSLKKNINDIKAAEKMNQNTCEYFQKVKDEMMKFAGAIDEIISGMKEMSLGTSDIINGVSSVTKMSQNVLESIKNIDNMIEQSGITVNHFYSLIERFSEKIANISEESGFITEKIDNIKLIGENNIQKSEVLNSELGKIENS